MMSALRRVKFFQATLSFWGGHQGHSWQGCRDLGLRFVALTEYYIELFSSLTYM